MDVTSCDSALMVYNEEVLESTAIPCSLVFQVEVSKRLEQFGGHEDFVVFLFHLDK